ncbi:PH domain-containing protein [Opitutus terrae]|uniref:YdbS-like PH domain-containing protein n=1 Tax=Opitutus terrae (strain DSM 11246 / JCM 15787 / PB90-1) TaxID=452637 RepID=B1ZYR2_OPITP|nr:PH domain-containing protein [Opitutus terrae]ACB75298.1 hypothetical protein Oter_2015 [Opitutus terrae PB90-1]
MNEEETVIWQGSPSQWTNFGAYVFWLVVTAAIVAAYFFTAAGPLVLLALAVPVLALFIRWLQTRYHVYEITTQRIRTRAGILSRHTTELELYRVRDYALVEPFWLRLVGRGHLVLETADRSNEQVVLRAVPRVAWLKDQVRTHTERMRQARGVRDLEINSP